MGLLESEARHSPSPCRLHLRCRLKDQVGSLSSFLLYAAYFLPTSFNAAWLSVATSIGVLIVPVSYKPHASLDAAAVVLAVLIVAAGES